ncbi:MULTISPECIES: type II toxin-antitoxin system RelE family toxin [Enterobacterales]|uniref:type II toxin-antitoxin system RelE family toxin n=1 Tax=Enterobacterales TaxID=91347 RepID=UPI002ED96CE1
MLQEDKLTIIWSRAAKKDFLSLDKRYQQNIEMKLGYLGDTSAPPLDIRKLKVPEDHYRLRVGNYRIIFTRSGDNDEICSVVAVLRRTSKTYAFHEEPARYEHTIYQR